MLEAKNKKILFTQYSISTFKQIFCVDSSKTTVVSLCIADSKITGVLLVKNLVKSNFFF